jgi:hypothetical protein
VVILIYSSILCTSRVFILFGRKGHGSLVPLSRVTTLLLPWIDVMLETMLMFTRMNFRGWGTRVCVVETWLTSLDRHFDGLCFGRFG